MSKTRTKPNNDQKFIDEFLSLATSDGLDAYTEDGAVRKRRFLEVGRIVARLIAGKLGFAPGQYQINVNPGGIAVCGDIHLYSDWIYISLEPSLAQHERFMYRACRPRGEDGRWDYGGAHSHNLWMPYELLRDLEAVCALFAGLKPRD